MENIGKAKTVAELKEELSKVEIDDLTLEDLNEIENHFMVMTNIDYAYEKFNKNLFEYDLRGRIDIERMNLEVDEDEIENYISDFESEVENYVNSLEVMLAIDSNEDIMAIPFLMKKDGEIITTKEANDKIIEILTKEVGILAYGETHYYGWYSPPETDTYEVNANAYTNFDVFDYITDSEDTIKKMANKHNASQKKKSTKNIERE